MDESIESLVFEIFYKIDAQMDEKKASDIVLDDMVYRATTYEDTEKKSSGLLYLSACSANLIAFVVGSAIAWTSPVLPKFNVVDGNNPFGRQLTSNEESWIAALLHLGGAFGPLIAGKSADAIGRKNTLLLISVPIGLSFLITTFASSINYYYFARIILGIGVGSIFAVLPNYLAEISQDHNRGSLGCIMGVFVSLGLLYDFAIGPMLTVRGFSIACLIPLCLFIILFSTTTPESPHYLAAKGKKIAVESTLKILRPTKHNTQNEMAILLKNFESSKVESKVTDLIFVKSARKALIICLGMIFIQQFSGINAVFSYMQSIFKATSSGISPESSTLIVGAIQTIITCVTTILVDRLGRKILLFLSALFSGLSLIALGVYFYLKDSGSDVTSISWIPISSLIIYIIAFNIGLGPLPWAVIGELFSSEMKAPASSLICCLCFLASFAITLFFPIMSATLGSGQSFWIFAACCLLGSIFIYFVIPETKGKTLEEIQKILEES